MRLVLACGCFDLFHAAHLAHLKEARSMGDQLVVALTLDEHINKLGRPIYTFEEREAILLAMECVDDVSACRDSVESILSWSPQVFVKGSDYLQKGLLQGEIDACRKIGAQIRFTKPHPQTTSKIIERIKCA